VLTGTTLTKGNAVELAQNGDETFPRLFEDLRSAKRSIEIQSYYGTEGEVADTLRRILLERAAAGVRVRFLYDVFGTEDVSADDREALRKSGVVVVPFRPLRPTTFHVMQNRSHVRCVLVDGRVGWTGGFGLDDKWLGDGVTGGAWRDTNVRFEGPAVRQLESAFAAAWTEATGVLLAGGEAREAAPEREPERKPKREEGVALRRAALRRADDRQHGSRALPRALDRRRKDVDPRHELLLRPRGPVRRAPRRCSEARRGTSA
jgi:cardiolipin synthase